MAYGASRIATRRVGTYPYSPVKYSNACGTARCGVPAIPYDSRACGSCDQVERYLYKADGSVHQVPEHIALYRPATTGLASQRVPLYTTAAPSVESDLYTDGYVVRTAAPLSAVATQGVVTAAPVVAPATTTFVDTALPYVTRTAPIQRAVQRAPVYVDPISHVVGDFAVASQVYPEEVLVRGRPTVGGTILPSRLVPSTTGPVGLYSRPLSHGVIPYTSTTPLPVDYTAYELGLTPPHRYGAVRRFTDYGDFTKYAPKPYYDGSYDYFADYTVGSLGAAGPAAGIAATTYTAGGPNPVPPVGSRYGHVYRTGAPVTGYVQGSQLALGGKYGYTVGSAPTYTTAAPIVRVAPTYRVQPGLLRGAPTYSGLPATVGVSPSYVPAYNDVVIEEGYGAPLVNLGPRYVAPPEITYY